MSVFDGLFEGLIGGVQGLAKGVEQISDERREQLAEELKMKALAKLDEARDQRRFTHEKSILDTELAHRTEERIGAGMMTSEENRKQREFEKSESALDRTAQEDRDKFNAQVTKEVAKLQAEIRAKGAKASADEKLKQEYLKMAKEAYAANNTALANLYLRKGEAGMQWKDVVTDPGSPGWFMGLGAREETVEERLVSDAGMGDTTQSTTPTNQETIDALLGKANTETGGAGKGIIGSELKHDPTNDTPQPATGDSILQTGYEGEGTGETAGEVAGDTVAKGLTKYQGWKLWVKNDVIWGLKPGSKQPVRVMVKPDEQINTALRNPETQESLAKPNPKYAEYLELLKLAERQ